VFTVGGRRPAAAAAAVAYDVPDDTLEVRVPVKAGPRVVGITFVRKSGALVESVREPFFTTHAEGGTRSQPSVASVTIAGPFAPTGVSETPSRQRISRAGRPTLRRSRMRRQILPQLARRAYRRPATRRAAQELVDFYTD
jgi:hypothetical protein